MVIIILLFNNKTPHIKISSNFDVKLPKEMFTLQYMCKHCAVHL